MHELNFIRENPEAFKKGMEKRGESVPLNLILELDKKRKQNITELQNLQNKKNAIAKKVSMNKGKIAPEDITLSKSLAHQIEKINNEISSNNIEQILSTLPNIPLEDVPYGIDESQNTNIRTHGKVPKFDFIPLSHDELGEKINGMDFATAVSMSGSRFVFLKNELALMERALASFMLEMHTKEFNFTEISTPLLVKEKAMYNVGQLPKFENDSFKTTCGFRLIPTGEVTLTNMAQGLMFSEEELPIRLTTLSQCFRSEAGSAGKDTKGIIRQHQFAKVELVSFTTEKNSNDELERIISIAEEVLKRLEIPFRTMLLCSGDMGFCSQKTYDLEAWMPYSKKYREISSCSNCGSFQARRLQAKYKTTGGKKNFIHTLNGSALAIGRTIATILENYQDSSGNITIPNCLKKYMNGLDKIQAIK